MYRYFFSMLCCTILVACSREKDVSAVVAQQASDSSQYMASAILNVPQDADILQSSKQAMMDVNASDVLAMEQASAALSVGYATTTISASDLAPWSSLPESCTYYFQRAERCYQNQANSVGLINMLHEQRMELADDPPDEVACQKLAQSFDAVANQLGCV